MNKHSRFILIAFTVLLCFSSAEQIGGKAHLEWKKYLDRSPRPEKRTELTKVHDIAVQGEVTPGLYLKSSGGICYDQRNGNVFISDWELNRILRFDGRGTYISQFGNAGQGPGDLLRPGVIACQSDKIAVYNAGNSRIDYFTIDGKYIKSCRVFDYYYDMALSDHGMIYAIPLFVGRRKDNQLIDVLNTDGKLVNSIGKYPKDVIDRREGWARISLNHLRREIIVSYCHFLVVQKYSFDGELVGEYRISHPAMEDRERENIKRMTSISEGSGLYQVIDTAKATKSGFVVLISYPRIEFMEFNHEGCLINDYWHEPDHDLGAGKDFLILDQEEGKKRFILLFESNYSSIPIFEITKKGDAR